MRLWVYLKVSKTSQIYILLHLNKYLQVAKVSTKYLAIIKKKKYDRKETINNYMVNLDRYIKTDFKIQQFNFKNLNLKFKLKYMNTIAHYYLLTQNFKFFLHDFDVNDIISIF